MIRTRGLLRLWIVYAAVVALAVLAASILERDQRALLGLSPVLKGDDQPLLRTTPNAIGVVFGSDCVPGSRSIELAQPAEESFTLNQALGRAPRQMTYVLACHSKSLLEKQALAGLAIVILPFLIGFAVVWVRAGFVS